MRAQPDQSRRIPSDCRTGHREHRVVITLCDKPIQRRAEIGRPAIRAGEVHDALAPCRMGLPVESGEEVTQGGHGHTGIVAR